MQPVGSCRKLVKKGNWKQIKKTNREDIANVPMLFGIATTKKFIENINFCEISKIEKVCNYKFPVNRYT